MREGDAPNSDPEDVVDKAIEMLETGPAAMRAHARPPMTRVELMETLAQMRASFLRIFANQHREDGIIPLPKRVIDHLTRAEEEVAQAGRQILDVWETLGDGSGSGVDAQ